MNGHLMFGALMGATTERAAIVTLFPPLPPVQNRPMAEPSPKVLP